MKERLGAFGKATREGADGERDVLAKIAEMQGPDRAMGERLHAIITGPPVPAPLAQDLVRDARLRQGRQGHLLLPECAEVHRRGTPRSAYDDAR